MGNNGFRGKNLKKIYTTRFGGNIVKALLNMSFTVQEGEYVAIMGEANSYYCFFSDDYKAVSCSEYEKYRFSCRSFSCSLPLQLCIRAVFDSQLVGLDVIARRVDDLDCIFRIF